MLIRQYNVSQVKERKRESWSCPCPRGSLAHVQIHDVKEDAESKPDAEDTCCSGSDVVGIAPRSIASDTR